MGERHRLNYRVLSCALLLCCLVWAAAIFTGIRLALTLFGDRG